MLLLIVMGNWELTGQRRYVKRRGRSHTEKEEQYSNTYLGSLSQENQPWCAVLCVLCGCPEPRGSALSSRKYAHNENMLPTMHVLCIACAMLVLCQGVVVISHSWIFTKF